MIRTFFRDAEPDAPNDGAPADPPADDGGDGGGDLSPRERDLIKRAEIAERKLRQYEEREAAQRAESEKRKREEEEKRLLESQQFEELNKRRAEEHKRELETVTRKYEMQGITSQLLSKGIQDLGYAEYLAERKFLSLEGDERAAAMDAWFKDESNAQYLGTARTPNPPPAQGRAGGNGAAKTAQALIASDDPAERKKGEQMWLEERERERG